jgi:hypothetical protein
MAYENYWPTVTSNLSATGGSDGRLSLTSTYGFYVRQKVTLSSGASSITGEVKEVLSSTVLRMGPDNGIIPGAGLNLSAFLAGGTLTAQYQQIQFHGNGNVPQIVYENEPTKALRVITVDPVGNYIDPSGSSTPISVTVTGLSVTVSNASLTIVVTASTGAAFQFTKVAAATITAGNASITQAFSAATVSATARIFAVLSSLDQAVGISVNGVQISELNQGESFGYDLGSNGRVLNSSSTIGLWNISATSVTGSVRLQFVS